MISLLFIGILVFFAFLFAYVGKLSSRDDDSVESFFLGSKKLGVFALTMTLLATQLGGGSLLGAADEAYLRGWTVIFYPLGISIGLVLLALGFGERLKNAGVKTTAEILEKKYGSIFLRRVAAFLSILTLFLILVAQGVAAKKFFVSLGFTSPLFLIAFWAVIIVYTTTGGFRAVVLTDVVQMFFVLLVLALVLCSFKKVELGEFVVQENLPSIPWVGWMLMPMLFMVFEQDMGQRCFAAKSRKSLRVAGIASAILVLVGSTVGIYLGVLANKMGLAIGSEKGVLMTVVSAAVHPVVGTFFAAALLMLVLSTADSLLCSIASNLVFDFKIKWPKSATLVTGGLAMLCSLFFTNVVPLMILSYELIVFALFVPTIMALFGKNLSPAGGVGALLSGVLTFVLLRNVRMIIPKEVVSLLISFAIYALMALPKIVRRRYANS